MKLKRVLSVLLCGPMLLAQENGSWRATSSTAIAITGDIALANEKLAISLNLFPVAQIRLLTAAELAAVFGEESGAGAGQGHLYRLEIPASKKFLRKNTLCGSDDVQWMTTMVHGKELQIAFFSGAKPPVFMRDAVQDSTDLCGTFGYMR